MGSGDLVQPLSHPFPELRPSPMCTSRSAHQRPEPLARHETVGAFSNGLEIPIASSLRALSRRLRIGHGKRVQKPSALSRTNSESLLRPQSEKALSPPLDTDSVAVTANFQPQNNRLGALREMFRIPGCKKECNTRTSQGVTHRSTTLAQARLTSVF